jgi:hypothetical protein
MPSLSYPGVYVEEVSSGVRPVDVASTSTAAFVGLAEMGPSDATRVTNWTEFQRLYGTYIDDGYLAHSVFQFFNNGGRQCYIVRVTRTDAATASVTVKNRAATAVNGFVIAARNVGAWGNTLVVRIADGSLDPANEFRLTVWRQDDPAVVPDLANLTPLEDFDNLSADPAAANFVGAVVKQGSSLITVTADGANVSVGHGTQRGGAAPTLPLNTNLSFQINLDSDGYQVVTLPTAVGTATAAADVAAAIQTAVRALTKKKSSTDAAAFSGFACTVDGGRLLLSSGTSTAGSSVTVLPGTANDATAQLKLGAGNGGLSSGGLAVRRPAVVDALQLGDATVADPIAAVKAGSDGTSAITELSFSGAFSRLDAITDFSLLAVPGEGTTAMFDLGAAYCANRPLKDVFYVGEMAAHDDTPDEAATFRKKLTTANSYGALYFPWVRALDPTGRSLDPILLPPSGHLTGLYARIDAARGVWKAPAGTEASLNGVVGLARELSDVEHGNLNVAGVAVIRRFPGAGIVSFGARTVTSDAEWRYVPVRRTAIMLRVSIYNGIQWAVFEPNDEPLWSQLRLNVGAFMMNLFRQGAFQGASPAQAFFVKCDSETTSQIDIDAGVVNLQVGFAPLKPAEFVVVKISQKAGLATG